MSRTNVRLVPLALALALGCSGGGGGGGGTPPPVPTVTAFSPAQAAPGERVTVTGANFAGTASTVEFHGARATVVSGGLTELVVVVPDAASSGRITVATTAGTGSSATDFVVTSAYVYVATGGGKIAGFGLDAATGALTALGSSPYDGAATTFAGHPSGRFLYVCNYGGNEVGAYTVATNGALAPIGTRVAAGSSPEVVKVHPSGKFLFAGNIFGGGTSIYTIDTAAGGLMAATPLSFGNYHHGLAFDPAGKYFYLARNNNNDVTRFVVDASTGAPSDPRTLGAAGGYHAAMDPQGRFLFVSDWDKSGANKVSAYALSTADGTVTKVDDYPTGGGNPAGVAVTPDGKFVYVANNSSGSVAAFSVNPSTGVLTGVTGTPFPVGGGVWELCIDRSGRWLYVGTSGGLAGFAIDPSTGALTALTGSPFAVSGGAGACTVMRVPR